MYVNPSEHIQQQLFWYGYYEKNSILTWEAFVKPDDIVFDIGANTGYYSLVAAPKAKRVYAFEPAQSIRRSLEKNIQLNKFSNISVEDYAISNERKETQLYLSDRDNTGMTGLYPAENFKGNIEFIRTITLDEWATDHITQRIAMIKIDAEGSEMNILTGMEIILKEQKPVIFIEILTELLKRFGHAPADIFKYLWSYGYTAYEPVKPQVLQLLSEPKESDTVIFLPEGYGVRMEDTGCKMQDT